MRSRGLTQKLSLAFAGVAAATVVIAALVIVVMWQRQFTTYLQRGAQESADAIAVVVGEVYASVGGWDAVPFAEFAHFSMAGGLSYEIVDADGEVLAQGTNNMMGSVMTPGEPTDAKEITARADIVVGGETVGEVRVIRELPGPAFGERDLEFRQASLRGLGLAALIALVLASIAGFFYSRGIVRPINEVTAAAEALRKGDHSARTGMTGGDPIADLGATFDQMADAVEAERAFEQQLTADVAHELRTPLQAIQATVEAMQDGVLPVDEERLALIHDETVRLGRLTGSIMELSRLESGAVPFNLTTIDLATPVTVAVESARALMESTGHQLEEHVAPGVLVRGDADRLTQAVGNLLSNAARYAPRGGTVRVRVLRDGAEAVIEVADSGSGVPEEDRANVFTRFWRADPARHRGSGGMGIGLAVVREVVERHCGTVGVHTSDLGGASFVIRLPLAEAPKRA